MFRVGSETQNIYFSKPYKIHWFSPDLPPKWNSLIFPYLENLFAFLPDFPDFQNGGLPVCEWKGHNKGIFLSVTGKIHHNT